MMKTLKMYGGGEDKRQKKKRQDNNFQKAEIEREKGEVLRKSIVLN